MEDLKQFAKIYKQLEQSKRIHEILDVNGEIQPTSTSIRKVQADHAGKSLAEKWHLAQTHTLLELAEKYQSDLK